MPPKGRERKTFESGSRIYESFKDTVEMDRCCTSSEVAYVGDARLEFVSECTESEIVPGIARKTCCTRSETPLSSGIVR